MQRKLVRLVAVVLAVIMALTVVITAVSMIAGAVTQAEIDQLKAKKKLLEQQKTAIQSEINSLKYDQASALAKKTILDQRIALTEEQIENISAQIEMYHVLVDEKEIEVEEAIIREENQWDLYKIRMRDMEENGAVTYISVLFDANSFIDLLARIDFVSEVMKADEKTYQDYVRSREETEQAKIELENLIAEAEEEVAALEEKEMELIAEVEESLVIINELESTLETFNAMRDEYDREGEKLQADINAKVAQKQREDEARAAAGQEVIKGTGTYLWPSQSSTYVTSRFGTRLHPIYKVYRVHNGVDIGAAYGTNVLAADTGTVITSTYNSSYGNYIVINHGGGMTTLYAHMSKRGVKVGDKVTKGDVIGQVGSTGASTGPHLHFEISKNGTRVNPLDYLSGSYTMSPSA